LLARLEQEEKEEVLKLRVDADKEIERLKEEYFAKTQEEIEKLAKKTEGKREVAVGLVVEKLFF
jgi:hypothetical protein